MKKIILKIVPIALVALLALPVAVQAKDAGYDSTKGKRHLKAPSYQGAHMNAMWSRFKVDFKGNNGKGEIIKNNPVFHYEIVSGGKNGNLANGDFILVNVINRGGNIVKQLKCLIIGLEVDEDDETKSIDLKATDQELKTTFGAVRLLNFNNQGTGSEVYLTDDQDKLGTNDRADINFYRGITIDGETREGDWEQRNKVSFGYDADDGQVWVELDAKYKYRAEYSTIEDVNYDTIQFMVLNRQPGSVVKLENIKINGEKIDDKVLKGDSDFPKWNLEGDIRKLNGNFTVEAELVITGDQPKNEYNKAEIVFGKK